MASGKTVAHPFDEVCGVEVCDGFERGNDVDGGIAGAGAAGDAAGEVYEVGEVAGVCYEDDFEGFGLEVGGLVFFNFISKGKVVYWGVFWRGRVFYPSRCNYGMDLSGAVDS